MKNPNLTIIVAEDHDLVRETLIFALSSAELAAAVVGACNGQQAIELVDKYKGQPLLFLMDIEMPVMNGINACQTIKKTRSDAKVIMLTSHSSSELVLSALAANADAYCLKDISTERLFIVIDETLKGGLWLDPGVAKVIQSVVTTPNVKASSSHDLAIEKPSLSDTNYRRVSHNPNLTEREQQVLKLITEGNSNKQIAEQLCMSAHTVKTHVTNIIQKMAVSDRTEAAVKAIKSNLV